MGNFLSAEVIDPLNVRIHLKAPQSTFVNVLGSLGIVSADKYNAKPMHKTYWRGSLSFSEFPAGSANDRGS